MNNRVKALITVIALVLIAAIGGTLAYFTDTEAVTNVMTVDDTLDIVQEETDENGNPFDQDQPLIPAGDDQDNAIEKHVKINNTGSTIDVYARTIIAYEHSDPAGDGFGTGALADSIAQQIHLGYDATAVVWTDAIESVQIGNQHYKIAVMTYREAIAGGTTSADSLQTVALDKLTTKEELAAIAGKYEVLALSQAVQADGFLAQAGETNADVAKRALDTAFGEVDAQNVAAWLTDIAP